MRNVQTGHPHAAGRGECAPQEPAPAPTADFAAWFAGARAEVEQALAAHLRDVESAIGTHSRLAAAVQYSVQVGGKRLRPILVLEACRACGGRTDAAWPAALAIELVHTFSLIHDDLPAMDNDDLRRGQPTNHRVFGEALAILAGDWLVTHALRLVATTPAEGRTVAELVRILADGTERMISGQASDIAGEGQPADRARVDFIHVHKTAALIETCGRLGAVAASAPAQSVAALADYGRHLGLAFQITDDLLDVTGRAADVGKRVGKDAVVAKQTYPAVYGVDESRRQAQREVDAALAALAGCGARAERLRELAGFVAARDR